MQQLLEALTDISRRGFLKGAAATAAACGLGGCDAIDGVQKGKRLFVSIRNGWSKNAVLQQMSSEGPELNDRFLKKEVLGPDYERWTYNGIGDLTFNDGKVSNVNYVNSTFNNYNEDTIEEDASSEDIARISYLAKHK